jgi:hypothetical protein
MRPDYRTPPTGEVIHSSLQHGAKHFLNTNFSMLVRETSEERRHNPPKWPDFASIKKAAEGTRTARPGGFGRARQAELAPAQPRSLQVWFRPGVRGTRSHRPQAQGLPHALRRLREAGRDRKSERRVRMLLACPATRRSPPA